jgi:hypothetical protein
MPGIPAPLLWRRYEVSRINETVLHRNFPRAIGVFERPRFRLSPSGWVLKQLTAGAEGVYVLRDDGVS